MIKIADNKIICKLKNSLTESLMDEQKHDFKQLITEITKKKYETIIFEAGEVNDIDIFGYQQFFYFYETLISNFNLNDKLILQNKTSIFKEFEERLGLTLC